MRCLSFCLSVCLSVTLCNAYRDYTNNRMEPYDGDMFGLLINAFLFDFGPKGIMTIVVQTFVLYRVTKSQNNNLVTPLPLTILLLVLWFKHNFVK